VDNRDFVLGEWFILVVVVQNPRHTIVHSANNYLRHVDYLHGVGLEI
jgi:hypothetical protein